MHERMLCIGVYEFVCKDDDVDVYVRYVMYVMSVYVSN